MTKAVIFSGTHSRHLYVHNAVLDIFDDLLVIVMQREELLPEPPKGLSKLDEINFKRHFKERNEVECLTYGDLTVEHTFNGARYHEVSPADLNGLEVEELVCEFEPDIAFIFGCDLIKPPLLSLLPANKINLHLGLSPWYRGAATLFWPFYFMQPQFAGTTFHQITEQPDAGVIIHQLCPPLFETDGIHDVGARSVVRAAEDARRLLKQFCIDKKFDGSPQRTSGRVWRGADFHASHLRVIYNLFDNDIVAQYLAGNLSKEQPKLFSCLRAS